MKEEQERKELEEYLKLKEAFSVEEEGFDQEDPGEEVVNVYFVNSTKLYWQQCLFLIIFK